MSFANALNVLRPTLPYYVALTKYGLLRITDHSFEFHPHPGCAADCPGDGEGRLHDGRKLLHRVLRHEPDAGRGAEGLRLLTP